jgi:hypothetical protein
VLLFSERNNCVVQFYIFFRGIYRIYPNNNISQLISPSVSIGIVSGTTYIFNFRHLLSPVYSLYLFGCLILIYLPLFFKYLLLYLRRSSCYWFSFLFLLIPQWVVSALLQFFLFLRFLWGLNYLYLVFDA